MANSTAKKPHTVKIRVNKALTGSFKLAAYWPSAVFLPFPELGEPFRYLGREDRAVSVVFDELLDKEALGSGEFHD